MRLAPVMVPPTVAEETIMVTILEVAGLPVVQVSPEVSTQEIASLFTGVQVKAELFVPALVALSFHAYTGVAPPLTGIAVKVTGVPAFTGLAEGTTVTLTGSKGLTVI
jgi:hypothetical protein